MKDPRNTDEIVVQAVVSLVAIFGIAGNVLVVVAVWKKRELRTTTNFLLVNVAVSDIISLVCLHFKLIERYVEFEEGLHVSGFFMQVRNIVECL